MNLKEAEALGERIAPRLELGEIAEAYALLSPTLGERTRFPHLQRIGKTFGVEEIDKVNPFLEKIASEKTEGGWVVIRGH